MKKFSKPTIASVSRVFKYLCLALIFLTPLLTFAYWIWDGFHFHLSKATNWYIEFSDLSDAIFLQDLSIQQRMYGFFVDLIPCAFFIIILIFIVKLLKEYEKFHFFSNLNIRRMRLISIFLLVDWIVTPFHTALKCYLLTPPGHKYILLLPGPNAIKFLILSIGIFIIAYLMEMAGFLEEDLKGIV